MSSIFNPTGHSHYIHVQPPRRSWLRVGGAFFAGGLCAALLFRIPTGSSQFLALQPELPAARTVTKADASTTAAIAKTSATALAPEEKGAVPTEMVPAPNRGALKNRTQRKPATAGEIHKTADAAGETVGSAPSTTALSERKPQEGRQEVSLQASATDATEDTPDASSSAAAPERPDDEAVNKAKKPKREAKRSRAGPDGRTVRILELPDGRRLRVYQDGTDGTAIAYGPSGSPRRVQIRPIERDTGRTDFFGRSDFGFWR